MNDEKIKKCIEPSSVLENITRSTSKIRAEFLFIFKDRHKEQKDMFVVLIKVLMIHAKTAFIHTEEYSNLIEELELAEQDFVTVEKTEDEKSCDERGCQIANSNEYQVIIIGKPTETEIAFMKLHKKGLKQQLREKKLFKFARSILPKTRKGIARNVS